MTKEQLINLPIGTRVVCINEWIGQAYIHRVCDYLELEVKNSPVVLKSSNRFELIFSED